MARENTVHEQQTLIEERFSASGRAQAPSSSPSSSSAVETLRQLLSALGWRGEERNLVEALPHFDKIHDVEEFRAVLARLNFETRLKKIKPTRLDQDNLPCLYSPDGHSFGVILERDGSQLKILDASQNIPKSVQDVTIKGQIYAISPVNLAQQRADIEKFGWMGMLARKFRPLFVQLLGLTFVINVFALAVPIYIMNVYDKAIGTKSSISLAYFFAGIAIVMLADIALRLIRGRALAYLGSRVDALLNPAAFQQILYLPITMTERVPIGSQISRLKQFEGIRDAFTGSLSNALLDLPFMLVFLAAIIVFGGAVAWVPVALIALYGIMAAFTIPITKRHVAAAGEMRAKSQSFMIELATKHTALRDAGAEALWTERFRSMAANAATGQFRSQQFSQSVQTVAQSMVVIAGVATLGIGTVRVMSGDMTLGALIAVMAMVWRVLSPVQAIFLSMNRFSQVAMSFRQINHLMRFKPEREPGVIPSFYRKFKGAINVVRASLRHTPRSEPAMMGLSVDIPPGQIVALAGPNGAGKTTLLKVITGLYQVQAGAVQVDGLDVRQLDVGELRHSIAYVPQEATFFYGTIEQNFRLSCPEATDAEIMRAMEEARVNDYAELMTEGLATRLTSEFQSRMPDGFKQRLMLARAYVKNAPIYLLDEPARGLDKAGDEALCAKLESLRGKSTVIMVTHRPSHMKLCDRVLYLEKGQLVHDGKPEQVLPLISQ